MRTFKIIVLSLGVVLGYGLGIAHIVRHRGYGDHRAMRDCMHACADAHHRGDAPGTDRGPRREPPAAVR